MPDHPRPELVEGHLSSGAKRTRLPNRRPSIAATIDWQGKTWLLGTGFDRGGKVREVFLNGPKIGSDAEALLADACVVISLLLQHGLAAPELARHLGREGIEPGAPAASPLGHIAEEIAKLEAEAGRLIGAAVRARETGVWQPEEILHG